MYEVPTLVESFCMNILNDDGSDNTVKSYTNKLNIFYEFINSHKQWNCNVKDITKEQILSVTSNDIEAFKSYLNNNGKTQSTRANFIAVLRSFYSYMKQKKIITDNIMNEVKNVSIPKRLPKYLTVEECEKLLDSIKGTHQIRDKAIITLFLHTGIRLSELVGIKLNHIKDNILNVIGKGDKEREVPLNKDCLKAIEDYLMIRPHLENDNTLFVNKHKGIINGVGSRAVQQMVDKYLKLIGRPDLSVHKLRHTAASLLYKSGASLYDIKNILGHEDITTTQIYTHLYNDNLIKIVNNNPLSKNKAG
jgi:site-specific recombinase XerD